MQSCLIKGKCVVSKIGKDGNAHLIDDGAVLVVDGKVREIGPAERLMTASPELPVYGSSEHVVVPGLVNAHHHVGVTPFQMGVPDMPFELWQHYRMRGRTVDLYLDTLYSAFEMVRSGVTTVQHLHIRAPGKLEDIQRATGEILRAYRDIGMRVSYSYCLMDQNLLVYQPDDTFLARLPADLSAEIYQLLAGTAQSNEEYFALFDALAADYANHPLVSIQLAPGNLQWCTDAALNQAAEISQATNTHMHMHLLETAIQKAYAQRRTGDSAVFHLDRLGLLGPRMTLGHGTWMTAEDLDLIAQRDARICVNCSSNLRLSAGQAPVAAMLERGIKVAIGIDEAGINDDRDMLQEMRQVLHVYQQPERKQSCLTSATVFRMASEHGAQTTGFGDDIGVIERGRSADLVLLKWSRVSRPYLDPGVPIVDAFVQRARICDIDTVFVNGRPILRNGAFTGLDEGAAIAELSRSLEKPLSPDELARRSISERLIPYVEDFYRNTFS